MAGNKSEIIGTIPKKDNLQIRASLTSYRNEMYIDIREYIESEEYNGPTKKGIRFHMENWEAFYDLVKKIDKEIKKRG
ncbi:transcriptional coactivator p15/PC4 family protein [bacterium]|nr:transcriptional coactivator p15/PC4 family protein [candidate division CSSED10-310 bacterium]